MNSKKYIVVYGSLRAKPEPFYNFNACGKQQFIKKFNLEGYELYSLGAYPAIIEGKGNITVELHEVDERTYQRIRGMELGAGYNEKQIEVDGKLASLYVYNNAERLRQRERVISGDWQDGV